MTDKLTNKSMMVLSEAIGYLEAHASKIDQRRAPQWWEFWKVEDTRPNHAREIADNLKKLIRRGI